MIDDAQLDLLVDGELSDAQRRDVLSRLDAEPGGWRRCALAFSKRRVGGEGMRDMTRQSTAAPTAVAPKSRPAWAPASNDPRHGRPASCWALGLGIAVDNLAGRQRPTAAPIPGASQVAEMSPTEESMNPEPSAVPSPSPEPVPEAAVPYRYVSVPAQDPVSGKTETIAMPVVPQEYLGEGWPYRLPSVLPERVVRTLEQQGHEVVQQRRLVPFQARRRKPCRIPRRRSGAGAGGKSGISVGIGDRRL